MLAFRRRQKMFARLTNRESTNTSKDDTLLYILGGIVVMFFSKTFLGSQFWLVAAINLFLVCNIPAAINLLFINETVKKRVDYQIFRAVANLMEITNHAAVRICLKATGHDYTIIFQQFYIFCVCSTDYRVTFMQKFPLPCFRVCSYSTDFKSVPFLNFLNLALHRQKEISLFPPTNAQRIFSGTISVSYE